MGEYIYIIYIYMRMARVPCAQSADPKASAIVRRHAGLGPESELLLPAAAAADSCSVW